MNLAPARVVVLISGRGSNLHALLDAASQSPVHYEISAVISNRADAPGLNFARERNIPTSIVAHRAYDSRAAFDLALADAVQSHAPDFVALAGFMRILGATFVDRFAGRLVNIHPSLLPAYRGIDTHRRALEAGEREHGASVHFVTQELDGGPVIAQSKVPVLPGDDAATLAARVLAREHVLYPTVLDWLGAGRVLFENDRLRITGLGPAPVLID